MSVVRAFVIVAVAIRGVTVAAVVVAVAAAAAAVVVVAHTIGIAAVTVTGVIDGRHVL